MLLPKADTEQQQLSGRTGCGSVSFPANPTEGACPLAVAAAVLEPGSLVRDTEREIGCHEVDVAFPFLKAYAKHET